MQPRDVWLQMIYTMKLIPTMHHTFFREINAVYTIQQYISHDLPYSKSGIFYSISRKNQFAGAEV